jgi:hypothetical protein
LASYFFFVVWDRVSLCSPGWPWTCNPPASASWVVGIIGLTSKF